MKVKCVHRANTWPHQFLILYAPAPVPSGGTRGAQCVSDGRASFRSRDLRVVLVWQCMCVCVKSGLMCLGGGIQQDERDLGCEEFLVCS